MAVGWSGARAGDSVLDVCTGSGDLAFLLAATVGPRGQVTALDFAPDILAYARGRQAELPKNVERFSTPIEWVEGDAMNLPFEDESFVGATMGYGLRNIADQQKALDELHRVLKRGGKVAILDFNNARENPTVDFLQSFMLANVVVPAASAVGLADEYEYLRPSIERFPTGGEQERMALHAGFQSAKHYPIMGGLMGCLVAVK